MGWPLSAFGSEKGLSKPFAEILRGRTSGQLSHELGSTVGDSVGAIEVGEPEGAWVVGEIVGRFDGAKVFVFSHKSSIPSLSKSSPQAWIPSWFFTKEGGDEALRE